MIKKRLYQVNLISRKRSVYIFVGLFLSAILLATCATVFVGVYSYIRTYLGESEDTLILTQTGTGNFIATRYISVQIAQSASYIPGISAVSPETLTPCIVNEKTCFIRGINLTTFLLFEQINLQAGRVFTSTDLFGALLGERAASRLGLKIGDYFLIYSGLRDISMQMEALGIYVSSNSALNDEIVIPLYAGQILSGNFPNRITYIRVKYNESIITREILEEKLVSQHILTISLLDKATSTPIENGQIEIYDIRGTLLKTGNTDSLGECEFSLDFGNYTIIAKYGTDQVNSSIFLENDNEIKLFLEQSVELYPITVKVWDVNRKGIPYSTVIAWKGSEIIQMQQTNEQGEVNFTLPADLYQFTTIFWNNVTEEFIEFRQTGNPSQEDSLIFWYKHYKLGIRTSDPYSGLLLNTSVTISFLNGTILKAGLTGALGYIEFEDLTPTVYNISVTFGEISQYQTIELRSDRTVSFEIPPRFSLEIKVYNDSTRTPINNSRIEIRDLQNNFYGNVTDINGSSTFILPLATYNITILSANYSKTRWIYLNSSRTETFWMPPYNLTIFLINITGDIQNNIQVKINSTSFDSFQFSQNGSVTFFLPPNLYNLSVLYGEGVISKLYDIFNPIDPLLITLPPYNLTITVLNGTISETPLLLGSNVTIFENASKTIITNTSLPEGFGQFLLNPGIYNISINISNQFYSKIVELNQTQVNLTFFSHPYNVTFTLRNGTTHQPQPGLQGQLWDMEGNLIASPKISNPIGQVSYLINPGIYNLTINNSQSQISKIVNVDAPNELFEFEFPPYNLTILVFNASTNLPIQNANIQILNYEDNTSLISKTSSASGLVQFALAPGKYYINLTYQNYNTLQYQEIEADPLISYPIPPYKLNVQVIDYWGAPINGANVSIDGGNPIQTNSSGLVQFFLDPAMYTVTASWNNFTDSVTIDLTQYQDEFWVSIRLTQKFQMNISCYNAINGKSLENASIEIYNLEGDLLSFGMSNQDGFHQFWLNPQIYNVSLTFEEASEYQLINLTTDTSIIFSIIPSYQLVIRAYDDSETHYTSDVSVKVSNLAGNVLFTDTTNEFGQVTFSLTYGTYNISLEKDDEYKSEIIDISQSTIITFHMAPYRVRVRAFNATTGSPIPNANIYVKSVSGTLIASSLTNQLGTAEFLLNEGQYFIYLNLSDHSWMRMLQIEQVNRSLQIVFSITLGAAAPIDVGNPIEYSASLIQQTLGLTESVVYVIAIILTILVSLSIMNVVSSSISETRRLIGIIRSLGASNRQVYYLINFRVGGLSALSGFLGGLLGIFLGSFISVYALEISLSQIITLDLFITLLLIAFGTTLLIGMGSSNFTLYKLLKMPIAYSLKEVLPINP
ncbi:MAG: FtsX-like permease family protein [Candidatus Helarchaeota archaeon]